MSHISLCRIHNSHVYESRVMFFLLSKGEALILLLLICKAMLVADWSLCPNMVTTSKSHTLHQKKTKSRIFNRDYNSYVLENLDRKKQVDI
jgi:hypothetical protein